MERGAAATAPALEGSVMTTNVEPTLELLQQENERLRAERARLLQRLASDEYECLMAGCDSVLTVRLIGYGDDEDIEFEGDCEHAEDGPIYDALVGQYFERKNLLELLGDVQP